MGIPKFNLVLTFKTTGGSNANLTINDVDETLGKIQIGALMDLIIANNIFMTKSGEFVSKVSAKLVATQQQEYELN